MASAQTVHKVAVWIRVPGLSMELFNDQFLWRLGSTLGTMLKIDRVTSIQARGQFARICVELDLDKPLESKVIARGHMLNLEYEGLHSICFTCGKYAHKANVCLENKMNEVPVNKDGKDTQKEPMQETIITEDKADVSPDTHITDSTAITEEKDMVVEKISESDSTSGPWMLVRKPNRKKNQMGRSNPRIEKKKDKNNEVSGGSGSCFHVVRDFHAQKENLNGNQGVGAQGEKHVFNAISGSRVRNAKGGKNNQRKKQPDPPPPKPNRRSMGSPKAQSDQVKPITFSTSKAKETSASPDDRKPKVTDNRSRKGKELEILEYMHILQKQNPHAGMYDTLRKNPMREATLATDEEVIRLAESLHKVFTMGDSSSKPPDIGVSGSKVVENSPMEGVVNG